ncbi:MAG TPA: protealysin inhibitor emfourin, partial [Nitrososphaeraceae archaeon]|nr:protealysin inhibitor emfourin [Nitrososphaeraceae archaeon]
DANELQNLIQKSNLFERSVNSGQQSKSQQSDSQQPSPDIKTKMKMKKGAADYFTYKITIQNGNKVQSMECNDVDMQTDVRGLVDFVTKHGQK